MTTTCVYALVTHRDPLDDLSLLDFARREPLEIGSTVEIPRHFKPASNPITLRVARKDTIEAVGRIWPTSSLTIS